jgi:hypothetical protein
MILLYKAKEYRRIPGAHCASVSHGKSEFVSIFILGPKTDEVSVVVVMFVAR